MKTTTSTLTQNQIDVLMQTMNRDRIATRSQGGKQLSYVKAHDIKATLIRIFGFGGFSSEVIDSGMVMLREHPMNPNHVNTGGQKSGQPKTPQVICHATVRLTIFGIGPQGQDAVYTESAIGSNSSQDIGDAADNAIKTAASDALKRCAINLGSQFGLSLYDNGQSYEIIKVIFAPGFDKYNPALQQYTPPASANPNAEQQLGHSLGARRRDVIGDGVGVTPGYDGDAAGSTAGYDAEDARSETVDPGEAFPHAEANQ